MTTLDITCLRSLITVASLAGVDRAARALHLSQPTVSAHLRRLEREIGAPVVFRQGRSIAFTARGEDLLREAHLIVAAHDAAVGRLLGGSDSALVVASTEYASEPMLDGVAALLRTEFPNLPIRYEFHRSARIREFVHDRTAAVAVGFGDLGRGVEQVADIPMSWVGATRAEADPGRLVAFARPCVIRERMLAAGGDGVAVERECIDLASLLGAVRSGAGVTALPTRTQLDSGLHHLQGMPPLSPVPLTFVAGARLGARIRDGIRRELRRAWSDADSIV